MIILIFVISIHPRKGFLKGCVYFLIPKISNLLKYRPWICGINQAIFLLMLGSGKNYLFSANITEKDNVYSRSTLTSLIILILGIF
jgi:SNF family Na+-dependent transporter